MRKNNWFEKPVIPRSRLLTAISVNAQPPKMKTAFALVMAAAASLVSAGVVITPVFKDQVIQANKGDCFFGVTTPEGCA